LHGGERAPPQRRWNISFNYYHYCDINQSPCGFF